MSAYAFWNNKGGVGKSFLAFVTACEYANAHPASDVYVIDLCPQANLSETLLGGAGKGSSALEQLGAKNPRATISGYLEGRLNSPFQMLQDIQPYVTPAHTLNTKVPRNVYLVCGDNLLEVQSEAIRQTSALAVPTTAWKQVINWVADLVSALKAFSGVRDAIFFIDCNPSFSVYTQQALAASDKLIVPFTADESSRRGIQNIVALLYGIGGKAIETYARINFAQRAKTDSVNVPTLSLFVSNRVTRYRGKPSSAFDAVIKSIKSTMDEIYQTHRTIFHDPSTKPSHSFLMVPDYHSACVVAQSAGIPLHRMKPGPNKVHGETVQLNKGPLEDYRNSLSEVVARL